MRILAKTKLVIEGLNLQRAIYDLQARGIELFDITKNAPKSLSFCIKRKDCDKVVAYLKKKCYNIKTKNNVGVSACQDFIKKHLVALIIFAICLLTAKITGLTCQQIVVIAPESVYDKVYSAIESAGVTKGKAKNKISLDSVENAVCVAVPEVKYAIADFYGSQLTVSIQMRTQADLIVDDTVKRDIVASQDGVIVRMLVLNGTPLVNVGDKVTKGQILIKGENIFADGTSSTATAKGEVWATVETQAEVKFCPTLVELLPTGSVIKRRRIKIWNYTSDFSKQIDYEYFSTETNYARLYPLGVVVEYETVYELKPSQRDVSLEEQLPALQLQAYEKLKLLLNGIEYDSVEYGTKTVLADTFVTVTAKTTQNIAIGG